MPSCALLVGYCREVSKDALLCVDSLEGEVQRRAERDRAKGGLGCGMYNEQDGGKQAR